MLQLVALSRLEGVFPGYGAVLSAVLTGLHHFWEIICRQTMRHIISCYR